MQRLHAIDLSGELTKDPAWVHLRLPAEFDPEKRCETMIGFSDPRTEKGELLFPARFPQEYIDKKKGPFGIGPMAFAAQDNQDPVAGDGNVFQRIWWRFWSDDPKCEDADTMLPLEFDELVGSWDMTFKDADDSDFVEGQIWGRKGANFYLLDEERGRLSYTDTRRAVIAMAQLWPEVSRWLVEDKANGPAILNDLRGVIAGLIPVTPRESKIARAQAVAPLPEAGNVFLPSMDLVEPGETISRYEWVSDFVEECLVGETFILRPGGWTPIQDVKVGDFVWTRVGHRRVLESALTNKAAQTWRLSVGEVELVGTAAHPVWTYNRGFVSLAELESGDALCSAGRFDARSLVVSAPPTKSGEADVYNLHVEGAEEYFANGILVHNCAAFPVAENDDRVDAMSQALGDLRLRALAEGAYLPAGTELRGNRPSGPDTAEEVIERFRRGGNARPKGWRVPRSKKPGAAAGLPSARDNPYLKPPKPPKKK